MWWRSTTSSHSGRSQSLLLVVVIATVVVLALSLATRAHVTEHDGSDSSSSSIAEDKEKYADHCAVLDWHVYEEHSGAPDIEPYPVEEVKQRLGFVCLFVVRLFVCFSRSYCAVNRCCNCCSLLQNNIGRLFNPLVDPRYYHFSCVDGRFESGILGTPGGDLGEVGRLQRSPAAGLQLNNNT